MTLLSTLANVPVVHEAVRRFRVQQIVETVLAKVPLRRKLRATGCEYRVRFLESLLMADEIFSREVYRTAFEGRDVRSFVDIGANVGYFTLYAAEYTGRRDLVGLSVDANDECCSEVHWHVERNRLDKTRVLSGVAGFPSDVTSTTFYVNPSNVASSAQKDLNPNVPAKGESRAVTVPTVDVVGEWKKLAGDGRIDLLKVDVEGFECDLIKNSSELLGLADRVVLEWHKWVTSLDEVNGLLEERGFVRRSIIHEDEHAGVAIFDRVTSRVSR